MAVANGNGERSPFFTDRALKHDLDQIHRELHSLQSRKRYELLSPFQMARETLTTLLYMPYHPVQLPTELIHEILDTLAQTSRDEAKMLTLVSKRCEYIATPWFFECIGDRQYLLELLPAFSGIPPHTSPRLRQAAAYVKELVFFRLSGEARLRQISTLCPNVHTLAIHDTLHHRMAWGLERASYDDIIFPRLTRLAIDPAILRSASLGVPCTFSHPLYQNLTTLMVGSSEVSISSWDWSSLELIPRLRNLCIRAGSRHDEAHWVDGALKVILHFPPLLKYFVLLFPTEDSFPADGNSRMKIIKMMPKVVYGCVTIFDTTLPKGTPPYVMWTSVEALRQGWGATLWAQADQAIEEHAHWVQDGVNEKYSEERLDFISRPKSH
ncbi:hypothetical protein DL96DRAFT_1719120 [Flagelloscypha sp. PMI_526]|nr:hypothetical protein DL96DRAFT_1719120 [Flagelloscypha sp. PMI_526]